MYVVYKYDNDGYFIGTDLTPNERSLPKNSTLKEPPFDENYWSKWNGTSWELELKPTSIEYYVDNNIRYNVDDESPINLEKISRLVSFVNKNSKYVYNIMDNFISVQEVKEEQESSDTELNEVDQEEQELESQINDLRNMYLQALMLGNTELANEYASEMRGLLEVE